MGKLVVESIGIADLLARLRTNAWLVPAFQRDFVWSEANVTSLVLSVIESRPIGMATLWEQPDNSELSLEPASIEDTQNNISTAVTIADDDSARPNKFYAVLDGRQRSTALAMAFGGLRATDARRRFSGRFFLDVKEEDVTERVRYIREPQVKANKYDQLSACVADGLFPLATDPNKGLMGQWMSYLQEIQNPSNYPNGELPDPAELASRNAILQKAFEGISETVLAVYVVPADYTLGEICEIFETLNTTGTRVSTVDLLHSWLFNDTHQEEEPILLREWIDDLGQLEGAVGWASKAERPEIIAQTVTACYIVLDDPNKPSPRSVGGPKKQTVSALKASDLLATPAAFWKEAVADAPALAGYIGDYQKCVSGTYFPLSGCPYPVTMAMYSALRWYMDHDTRYANQWSVDELDAIFRAFFWRNALTGRYDQGFLSQSATDLKDLKEILFQRAKASSANSWASEANEFLAKSMGMRSPTLEETERQLLQAKPAGALGQALSLPVRTRPKVDLLDPSTSILFPSTKPVELHHIYPQAWCASNRHGALEDILDPNKAEYDYVRSVANSTPLTRESNNDWRAKTPGQALAQSDISFGVANERLESHFISKTAYEALTASTPDPKKFWEERARVIGEHLIARCNVFL